LPKANADKAKNSTVKNKKSKRGLVIVSDKLIEIPHIHKTIATPQFSKRSLMSGLGHDSSEDKSGKKVALQQYLTQNSNQKKKEPEPKAAKIQPRMQNFMMTPSQNLVHSRKLLQMKTVGVSNQITDSKVKEEDDIKNMKPSSEFFCKMDYINQLREDKLGVNTWEKSFSDAINEVNIQNKEYLECIDLNVQRRFGRISGLCKKTVVFGLDGVLVKTNFEKDKDDWKPATLMLNESTGTKITIYVSVRPFVVNTLRQLRRAGVELILYSSSQYNYTSAILDILTKQKIEFHHII
jgi:NLI interacting factor-like phosphatase